MNCSTMSIYKMKSFFIIVSFTHFVIIFGLQSSNILQSNIHNSFLHSLRERNLKKQMNLQINRQPPGGSLFTWDSIVDEARDTVFNATFADLINDYKNPEKCPYNKWQYNTLVYMREILSFWSKLAKTERIPYVLAFGSLLGYARNQNYTPYDADMDIFLPIWAYDVLLAYQTRLPIAKSVRDGNFTLFLHPEFQTVPPELQRRYSCDGTIKKAYEGLCSFTGLIGRLSLNHRHMDLFALDHFPEQNLAIAIKHNIYKSNDPGVFFPPRKCTFFGVPLLCPNNYVKLLKAWYGPTTRQLRPTKLCNDTVWQSRRDNQELFKARDDEWEKKFGHLVQNESVAGLWVSQKSANFCAEVAPKLEPTQYGFCNWPQ